MDPRTQALQDIADIARTHGISPAEIAAVLEEPHDAPADSRRRDGLVRVLGYLGGTFVFAGIGIFIATHWDSMGSAARVAVTLGPGVAAFVLALLGSREARYASAVPPMFLVAAVLEPSGMLVAFAEFGSGGDWRLAALTATGTMAVQFGLAFGGIRQSTPLFFTLLFATLAWWTTCDLMELDGGLIAVLVGAAVLLAAAGVARTHEAVTPAYFFVGGAAFLGGLFDLVQSTALEIVFLAAASALMYASVAVRSRALLAVSTLAILGYTGWFTGQHFADSIGWPLALVAFGFALIALSALAFRIDRRYMRPREPAR